MFEEFRKSLKASLYERTASPIIGAFVSAWLLFNWKLCLIIAIADDTIYERLAYIEKSPYIDIWPNLYYPIIAAVVFIGFYPLVSLLPYKWWEWYAKKKAEIKNGMQRGILISLRTIGDRPRFLINWRTIWERSPNKLWSQSIPCLPP